MAYWVKWEINLEASSPESAALKAREIQLDPNSTATIFDVSESEDYDDKKIIDLEEL